MSLDKIFQRRYHSFPALSNKSQACYTAEITQSKVWHLHPLCYFSGLHIYLYYAIVSIAWGSCQPIIAAAWKDTDAGKDWKREEKGTTEDEMVGWHHQLNGHEFEQTPGVGDGQGGLACCSPWGHKESETTEQLNWTDWPLYIEATYSLQYTSFGLSFFHPCPSPEARAGTFWMCSIISQEWISTWFCICLCVFLHRMWLLGRKYWHFFIIIA